jgi:hypothetical protein
VVGGCVTISGVKPMSAAAIEAQRLGQSIAGPELVLLALLRKDCDAAGILGDFGFNAAVIESSLMSRREITDAGTTSITFPPIMYRLDGRVEAFAVALGDGRATPEHTLLAMMWDTHPQIGLVDGVDIRPAILERLAGAGHAVPRSAPPPLAAEWTQRVVLNDAHDADLVLTHLNSLKLRGWGWNVNEHGTRWFVAPRQIDLLAIIEQAIGPGRAREVGFETPDSDLT